MRRYDRFPLSIWLIFFIVRGSIAPAAAGEFYEHEGVAIQGYDPVAYMTEQHAMKGSPHYAIQHKGSIFYFSSAANRDTFEKQPERFVPQYGGYCAYGVSKGYKASIDPNAFTIVEGKLYLNYSRSVMQQWRADIPGYIQKADRNWPHVSRSHKVYR